MCPNFYMLLSNAKIRTVVVNLNAGYQLLARADPLRWGITVSGNTSSGGVGFGFTDGVISGPQAYTWVGDGKPIITFAEFGPLIRQRVYVKSGGGTAIDCYFNLISLDPEMERIYRAISNPLLASQGTH